MKLEINQKCQKALEKIGISIYEMESIEAVLMRMAQLIYILGENKNE